MTVEEYISLCEYLEVGRGKLAGYDQFAGIDRTNYDPSRPYPPKPPKAYRLDDLSRMNPKSSKNHK